MSRGYALNRYVPEGRIPKDTYRPDTYRREVAKGHATVGLSQYASKGTLEIVVSNPLPPLSFPFYLSLLLVQTTISGVLKVPFVGGGGGGGREGKGRGEGEVEGGKEEGRGGGGWRVTATGPNEVITIAPPRPSSGLVAPFVSRPSGQDTRAPGQFIQLRTYLDFR